MNDFLRKVSWLLMALCLVMYGCSQSAAASVPESLAFFDQNLSSFSKEEIRQALRDLISWTIENLPDGYMISQTSAGSAGSAQYDELGNLTGFDLQPFYKTSFRAVSQDTDASRGLYWSSMEAAASQSDEDATWLQTWNEKDEGTESTEIEKGSRSIQMQWLAECLSSGVYTSTRYGEVLDFYDNPMVYPANPEYFSFSVGELKEQDPEKWVLSIQMIEPDAYSASIFGAYLGYDQSLGEQLDQTDIDWFRVTFNEETVQIYMDENGVIVRIVVKLDVSFQYVAEDKTTIKNRETLTTTWNLDSWNMNDQQSKAWEQLMNGTAGPDLVSLMDGCIFE